MNQRTEQVDPKTLKPNPWNVNVMSPDNEEKLETSIKRFGMFKPAIVRELQDGFLQIIGGEHRVQAAVRLGIKEVPIVNLGKISDEKAKEISLVDNGRFGHDDTLRLAELLEGLGDVDELSSFMPYTESDLTAIFSSSSIALDALDLSEEDESPKLPTEKAIQTHQILRFKIPVEDVGMVTAVIESIAKTQKFTQGDSLSNAGDALVHLCNNH